MGEQGNGSPSLHQNHDRLNGWKEIATHLGKSVRTVQRWERELHLPVHRIGTAGGDVVFAYQRELEQWLAEVDQRRARELDGDGRKHATTETEEAGEVEEAEALEEGQLTGTVAAMPNSVRGTAPRRWRRAIAITAGVAVGLVAFGYWARHDPRLVSWAPNAVQRLIVDPGEWQPKSWKVDDNSVRVFDERNRLLWEHHFPFALVEASYNPPGYANQYHRVALEDLDNDGKNELLFVGISTQPGPNHLYCFNADGNQRFMTRPDRTVRFGGKEYAPPFYVRGFVVTREPDGTKSVWALAAHNYEFPAVLQKLTPRGEVAAEYWSNGHIASLSEGRLDGRRVMLVGATNNERVVASLAALDYDHPSGSAPAENPKFRCDDCAQGAPLVFYLFPRMETSREFDQRPNINEIRAHPDGRVTVTVLQSSHWLQSESISLSADVWYTLDSRLRSAEAQVGDAYRKLHASPELNSRLKHSFGPKCEAQMFPVLSWNGQKFAELPRPSMKEKPAKKAAALARNRNAAAQNR